MNADPDVLNLQILRARHVRRTNHHKRGSQDTQEEPATPCRTQ
jgi:hypothetical protein